MAAFTCSFREYYYICSLSFLSKDSYDHLKMVIKLNLD